MAITKDLIKDYWPDVKKFIKENDISAFHYNGISMAVMITPTMLHFAFAAASLKDKENLKPKFGMKIAAFRLWEDIGVISIPNGQKWKPSDFRHKDTQWKYPYDEMVFPGYLEELLINFGKLAYPD